MKNLTVDYFDKIEFLPYLVKYFALSPDNKVTCKGYFEHVKITYYQDDDGFFHKVVDLGDTVDGYKPYDFTLQNGMDLDTLLTIISQLESLPQTLGEGFVFKNMKEQVFAKATAYFDPRYSHGGWDRSR